MYKLNRLRSLILKQDEELEDFILKYTNKYNDIHSIKITIEKLIEHNEFENATKILEKNKDKLEEFYYLSHGVISLCQGEIDDSLNYFLKVLEIDEYNVDALYNIGYLNIILDNLQEALILYNKCLNITEDKKLILEIKDIIDNINIKLSQDINYTFVVVGYEENESIFNHINKNYNEFINIIDNENIKSNKVYKNREGIKIYEINSKDKKNILEYILRKYNNVVFIFSDLYKCNLLMPFKGRAKFVYYKNINYYTDKKDYLNKNARLFLEKECFRNIDFAVTNDINFYNYKIYMENRDNVYFIDKNISKSMTLDYVVNNIYNNDEIKYYIEKLQYEHDKIAYSLYCDIYNGKLESKKVKYLYEKYNTEEYYTLYLYNLVKNKEYKKAIELSLESKYCKDIFAMELLYLYLIDNLDLFEFLVHISIGNFALADVNSDNELEYRLGILNFETNKYTASYDIYTNVLKIKSSILSSPIVNRNIAYLMYMHQNNDYKKYYKIYKEFMRKINKG